MVNHPIFKDVGYNVWASTLGGELVLHYGLYNADFFYMASKGAAIFEEVK